MEDSMSNKQIVNNITTDLEQIRIACDDIKMDHASIIKIVEAKSDIRRAIQKLEKVRDSIIKL